MNSLTAQGRAGLLTLLVLALALPSLAMAAKKSKRPLEWYIKTSVEVVNPADGSVVADTRSGVFGQMVGSSRGWDKHDVPVFATAQYSRAAIVFIHGDDWGDRAGEYLSDYRAAGKRKDEWPFTVYSSLQSGTVTLHWGDLVEVTQSVAGSSRSYNENKRGNHKLLKKLHLVDLQTGEVIDVSSGRKGRDRTFSYSFSMVGTDRRDFRWVLGPIRGRHLEPLAAIDSETAAKNKSGKSGKKSSKARSGKKSDKDSRKSRNVKSSKPPVVEQGE